jgi:hypothetical protein
LELLPKSPAALIETGKFPRPEYTGGWPSAEFSTVQKNVATAGVATVKVQNQ